MSWDAFLNSVQLARDELRCSKSGAWFRGVSHYRHRLYPSLFRPGQRVARDKERAIYEEYSEFSDAESFEKNSWERLARLQHFGTPTRLLDWTETLGVAIYFATRQSTVAASTVPAIWIINPFTISQIAKADSADKTIADFHNDPNKDYYECFIKNNQWPFDKPMPFRPPKLTPRIRAQRGFFTVHGNDLRPLDAIYRGHVRQIRLSEVVLKSARLFLDNAGIDSLSLFPDIEGFTRRIHDRYQN